MTVKELIERLQREPPDNIVYILDADTGYRPRLTLDKCPAYMLRF